MTDPTRTPRVFYYDDTCLAYYMTQADESMRDGDVLVIANQGVVAILAHTWPIALTAQRGKFFGLTFPVAELDDGKYRESVRIAAAQARVMGVELLPEHQPADTTVACTACGNASDATCHGTLKGPAAPSA